MDYMYGELNDLVKNINYEGLSTSTAYTTVDNINRKIAVNVNAEEVTKNCATKEELNGLDQKVMHKGTEDIPSDEIIYGTKTWKSSQNFDNDITLNLHDITGVNWINSSYISSNSIESNQISVASGAFRVNVGQNGELYVYNSGYFSDGHYTYTVSDVGSHLADTSNPHNVTKEQIGLGNVDNTADLDKPVSTAVQDALDLKVSKSGSIMTGPLTFQDLQHAYSISATGEDGIDIKRDSTSKLLIKENITTISNDLRLSSMGSDNKSATTKEYVDNGLSEKATVHDLGNNLFTLTDPDITVDMQHSYQIGNLLFVHLVFHRASAPSDTGTYKIGTLSKHALHQHSFAVSGYNNNTGNTLNEAGVLTTSGDVKIHFTKSTATSNVQFDAEFFFCEGH